MGLPSWINESEGFKVNSISGPEQDVRDPLVKTGGLPSFIDQQDRATSTRMAEGIRDTIGPEAFAQQIQERDPQLIDRYLQVAEGDPRENLAKLYHSAYLASKTGYDTNFVMQNYDKIQEQLYGRVNRPMDAWSAVVNEFNSGMAMNDLSDLYNKMRDGSISESDQRRIEALEQTMPKPEEVDRWITTDMAKAVANVLPFMGRVAASGALTKVASIGVGALVSGMTGGLALPAFIPWLIAASGGFLASKEITQGLSYREMIGSGVSHETARIGSGAVSAISGAIEMVSGDLIPGGFSVSKWVTDALTKSLLRGTAGAMAARFGTRYVTSIASEIAQEIAQESVEFLGAEIAKDIDNVPVENRQNAIDYLELVKETARQTLLAQIVLGGVTGGVQSISDYREIRMSNLKDPASGRQLSSEDLSNADPGIVNSIVRGDSESFINRGEFGIRNEDGTPKSLVFSGRDNNGNMIFTEDRSTVVEGMQNARMTLDKEGLLSAVDATQPVYVKKLIRQFLDDPSIVQKKEFKSLIKQSNLQPMIDLASYVGLSLDPREIPSRLMGVMDVLGLKASPGSVYSAYLDSENVVKIDSKDGVNQAFKDGAEVVVLNENGKVSYLTRNPKHVVASAVDPQIYERIPRVDGEIKAEVTDNDISVFDIDGNQKLKINYTRQGDAVQITELPDDPGMAMDVIELVRDRVGDVDLTDVDQELVEKFKNRNPKRVGLIKKFNRLRKDIGKLNPTEDQDAYSDAIAEQEMLFEDIVRADDEFLSKKPRVTNTTYQGFVQAMNDKLREKVLTRKEFEDGLLDVISNSEKFGEDALEQVVVATALMEISASRDGIGFEEFIERNIAGVLTDAQAEVPLEALAQGNSVRGAAIHLNDARTLLQFSKNADFSTLAHEWGHALRPRLPSEDIVILERVYGVEDGEWSVANEEQFTADLEKYLINGEAPVPGLKRLFEKVKQYMRHIYQAMLYRMNLDIDPEVKGVLDRIFTPGPAASDGEMIFMQGLETDYDENLIQTNGSSVLFQNELNDLVDFPRLTISDLKKMTDKVFPIFADRTSSDLSFSQFRGTQFEEDRNLGGPFFGAIQEFYGKAWWANDDTGVRNSMLNRAKQTGGYGVVVMMDKKSHRSNRTAVDNYLKIFDKYLLDGDRISDDALDTLHKQILKNKDLKDVPSFRESVAFDTWLKETSTFGKRSLLMNVFSNPGNQALGLPPMDAYLNEIIESRFNVPSLNLGDALVVVKLDVDNFNIELGEEGTIEHPSYKHGIRGKIVGVLDKPIGKNILFDEYMRTVKNNQTGQMTSNEYRAASLSSPIIDISGSILELDSTGAYKDISGGVQAKVYLDGLSGAWKESGKKKDDGGISPADFINAMKNNPGSSSLTPTDLKTLNKNIKDGKERVFQLGDNDIYFSLKYQGDDIILSSVINNQYNSAKGVLPFIMAKAIEEGVTHLDAFAVKNSKFPNGMLTELYSDYGFEVVDSYQFDADYYLYDMKDGKKGDRIRGDHEFADLKAFWESQGWSESDGYPDVVVMKLNEGEIGGREKYLQRFISQDGSGIWGRGDQAEVSILEGDILKAAEAEERNGSGERNDRETPRNQGDNGRRSRRDRFQRTVYELLSLEEIDRKNLGIDKDQLQKAQSEFSGDQPLFRSQEDPRLLFQPEINAYQNGADDSNSSISKNYENLKNIALTQEGLPTREEYARQIESDWKSGESVSVEVAQQFEGEQWADEVISYKKEEAKKSRAFSEIFILFQDDETPKRSDLNNEFIESLSDERVEKLLDIISKIDVRDIPLPDGSRDMSAIDLWEKLTENPDLYRPSVHRIEMMYDTNQDTATRVSLDEQLEKDSPLTEKEDTPVKRSLTIVDRVADIADKMKILKGQDTSADVDKFVRSIQTDINVLKKTAMKYQERMNSLGKKQESLKDNIKNSNSQIKNLERDIEKMIREEEKTGQKQSKQIQNLNAKINRLQDQIISFDDSIKSARQEMKLTKKLLDAKAQARVEREKDKIAALRYKYDREKKEKRILTLRKMSQRSKNIDVKYKIKIRELLDPYVSSTRRKDIDKKYKFFGDAGYQQYVSEGRRLGLQEIELTQIQEDRTGLNELTWDQLVELENKLIALRKEGADVLATKKANFNSVVDNKVSNLLDATLQGDEFMEERLRNFRDKPDKLKSLFIDMLNPQRIFNRLDGGGDFDGSWMNIFVNQVNKAENEYSSQVNRRMKALETKMSQLGIKKEEMFNLTGFEGMDTVQDVMGAYMMIQDRLSKRAVVYGNLLGYDRVMKAIDGLDQKFKDLGDWMMDVGYSERRDDMRQVMQDVFNEDMEYVERYAPIMRISDTFETLDAQLKEEFMMRSGFRMNVGHGNAKSRIEISEDHQKPVRLDQFNLYLEMIPKQERLINHAPVIKELNAIVADDRTRLSIKQKLGVEYYNAVKSWVGGVANPTAMRSQDNISRVARGIRNNAAVAYLAFNMVTVMKQLPSIALFMNEGGLIRSLASVPKSLSENQEAYKRMITIAPQMKNRNMEVWIHDLSDLKSSDEQKTKWRRDAARTIKKIGRAGTAWISMVDRIVVTAGWNSVFDRYLETHDGATAEQASDYATNVVLRSQPASGPKNVAAILARDSALTAFTQFSSQLNQMFGMLSDIPGDIMSRDSSRMKRAMNYLIGIGLSGVMMAMIGMKKIPDDEDEWKEFTSIAFVQQFLSTITVAGPAFVAYLNGYEPSTSIMALPESAARITQSLAKALEDGEVDEKFWRNMVRAVGEGAAVGVGLPYMPIHRGVMDADNLWDVMYNVGLGGRPKE